MSADRVEDDRALEPFGRTWLFVPGDRPDRFDKAASAGADHVILDLEDAVADADKTTARAEAVLWLAQGGVGWVRVNGVDTVWHNDDLASPSDPRLTGLRGIVAVKATLESVETTEELLATPGKAHPSVVALVESAAGVRDAVSVAAHPAVAALAFGPLDYCLDLGCDPDSEALRHARHTIVMASRAAGLPGPIDGPTVQLSDVAAAEAEARAARSMGFSGKLCIHPRQVGPVSRGFAPRDADVAWAQRIVEGVAGLGRHPDSRDPSMAAVRVDGQMIDRPLVLRARRILSHHASIGHASSNHKANDGEGD